MNTTTGTVEYLNPEGLHRNPAFSQAAVVRGPVRTVYVGGQNAVTAGGQIAGPGDLKAQAVQALHNVQVTLEAAGAALAHVVKWNVYLVQGQDPRPAFEVFREAMAGHTAPPLVTVLFVSGLANPGFLMEIEAMAIVPE